MRRRGFLRRFGLLGFFGLLVAQLCVNLAFEKRKSNEKKEQRGLQQSGHDCRLTPIPEPLSDGPDLCVASPGQREETADKLLLLHAMRITALNLPTAAAESSYSRCGIRTRLSLRPRAVLPVLRKENTALHRHGDQCYC